MFNIFRILTILPRSCFPSLFLFTPVPLALSVCFPNAFFMRVSSKRLQNCINTAHATYMFNIFRFLVAVLCAKELASISTRTPNLQQKIAWLDHCLQFVSSYMCCIVASWTPPGRTYRADASGNTSRAYQTLTHPVTRAERIRRRADARNSYVQLSRRHEIVCPKVLQTPCSYYFACHQSILRCIKKISFDPCCIQNKQN